MPSAAPPGIGTKLRQARLDRSLSIEETAWRTRIRPELLRALEGDDFEQIGHAAHVRSHLHSYARFLGMDPTELVEEFTTRHAGDELSTVQELERQRKAEKKPPRPKWLIAALVSAALLIAAAAAGVIGGQGEGPVVAPSPAVSVPEAIESAGSVPVPAAEARVRLRVEALRAVQISVLADGQPLFEGELDRGVIRTFNARQHVEVLVADGGSVSMRLNGSDLGTPGERGAVFRQRYGPNGPIDG